jgi:maleylacetate reductase
MHAFHYTSSAQEVIFGADALARLGEAIDRRAWRRVLVCASGSQRRNGHLRRVEDTLGARVVAVYDGVQPHVPAAQVAAAFALATEHHVDAVMGLGGGSAIGVAKAASFALEERQPANGSRAAPSTDRPRVPVVAIPTTYAGSEMTPVYGVTRQEDGTSRKVTVTDPRIAPSLVLYDPTLTLDLPAPMTAASGINALAHCIEALYSVTRHPLSTAAAREGVRLIASALPRCHAAGDDLEARTELLAGAHLAGTALATVSMGLHHGLCHVLGGTAGVPHGIANAIVLPHAMRFNLEATAPELALAAPALGVAADGLSASAAAEAVTERVEQIIGRLGLPRRLRDVGVSAEDLPRLAQLALGSRAVQTNPRPIDAAALAALLRAAW